MTDASAAIDQVAERLWIIGHKKALLGTLRAACAKGHPFDEDDTWLRIVLFVHTRQDMQELIEQLRDQRNEMLTTVPEVLKLRNKIDRLLGQAHHDLLPGVSCGEVAEKVGNALTIAAWALQQTGECGRRPRHRPKGSGLLPPSDLKEMAYIFVAATRRKPSTAITGHFVRFVATMCAALDIDISDEGIKAAILKWRVTGVKKSL